MHFFTSVGHPQANREAEITNIILLQGLKTQLNRAKGAWLEELHHVLWAYGTMQRVLTDEIPFNLAFETEAVILLELGLPSFRVENFNVDNNSEYLRANLCQTRLIEMVALAPSISINGLPKPSGRLMSD